MIINDESGRLIYKPVTRRAPLKTSEMSEPVEQPLCVIELHTRGGGCRLAESRTHV